LEIVKLTLFLPPRKNLLFTGKQFFHLRQIFFVSRHTNFSVARIYAWVTDSEQDEKVRRPVEKRVVLRGVLVKLNHSST